MSAAVAVLVAELSLRTSGVADPAAAEDLACSWVPGVPVVRDVDREISFTLAPGFDGEKVYRRKADGGVVHRAPVSISADGFRNTGAAPGVSGADARVILGVGDSVTFGEGVADGETYLAALERRLADRGPVRVLNGGVPSWNMAQEIRWIETRSAAHAPDVLILGFYVNDLEEPAPFQRGEFESLRELELSPPPDAIHEGGWRARSHLVNLVARWLDHRRAAELLLDGYADERALLRARFAEERSPRLLREGFARLASHCDATGTRCVVLLFPLMHTVHGDPLADVLGLAENAARGAGLEVLDVTPALQAVPIHDIHVLPADAHLSAAAHEAVARYLDQQLDLGVDP